MVEGQIQRLKAVDTRDNPLGVDQPEIYRRERINNPVQMWIWRDGAFEPIVTASLFEQAKTIIESRHSRLSDQELLERLRQLLRLEGRLSGILLDLGVECLHLMI